MTKKQDEKKTIDSVIDSDKFVGHLVTFLVSKVREMQRPWQQLSEAEQERFIDTATQDIMVNVEKCKGALSGQIRQTLVQASVEAVNTKKGYIAISLKASDEADGRHELADHTGKNVFIVIDNLSQFVTSNAVPKAEKQQKDMLDDVAKSGNKGKVEAALGDALREAESE